MAKVRFPNKVKYNGVFYAPGEVIEVTDKEAKLFVKDGAIVEEKPSRRQKADNAPDENGDDENDEDGDGTPQE